MKKTFCAILTLAVIMSTSSIVFAVDSDKEVTANEANFWIELSHTQTLLDNKEWIPSENASAKLQVNKELKHQGFLFIDSKNHLSIAEKAWDIIEDTLSLDLLSQDYIFANTAIDDGILTVDPETLELRNRDMTEESLQQMKDNDLIDTVEQNIKNGIVTHAAPHCSYRKVNFGNMVRNNRTELKNYLRQMEILKETNPGVSPGVALLNYWIGKVQSGGAWDYKTVPGYSPWNTILCLTYGINNSKVNYHRTSEFMGNYNYGFTGRMIFPLSILKVGSNGAAGNPFVPDRDDYPAIEEGYNDARV